MSDNYIFIYGSLKRGYHNNHWLGKSSFLNTARTADAAYEMHPVTGFFPLVVAGNYRISGELFVVDDDILAGLDYLEGNGMSYTRQQIKLSSVDVLVWMYVYNYPDQLPPSDNLGVLVGTDGSVQTWLNPNDHFEFKEENT